MKEGRTLPYNTIFKPDSGHRKWFYSRQSCWWATSWADSVTARKESFWSWQYYRSTLRTENRGPASASCRLKANRTNHCAWSYSWPWTNSWTRARTRARTRTWAGTLTVQLLSYWHVMTVIQFLNYKVTNSQNIIYTILYYNNTW